MIFVLKRIAVFVAVLACGGTFSNAQDTPIVSGYGASDPAVPELGQYDFFRGDWRVDMRYRTEDGSWQQVPSPARVRAFFHADGRTFQTIFTTESGFFSTDIRSWDVARRVWRVHFLNANDQRWHDFEAAMADGKMMTFVPGGYGGNGPDIKTEIGDISENQFTNNVFQRLEDGTWHHTYKMSYVREAHE